MSYRVNHKSSGSFALMFAIGAIATGGGIALAQEMPAAAANGPAADFPVVLGAPYSVGDTTYTPGDAMNYDAVGYAAVDADGGTAVSAAHHTLPLPSYVEVTSLESGRTILVRVERRGPMTATNVIALSPGAAQQLGVADGAAVRVRRVNPPENERAALRAGGTVAERMPTPKPLLAVLNHRLTPDSTVPLNAASNEGAAPPPAATNRAPAMAGAAPAPAPAAPAPRAARVRPAPRHAAVGADFASADGGAPAPAPADTASAPAPAPAPRHRAHAAAPVAPAPAADEAAPAPQVASGGGVVIQAGAFGEKAHAQSVASRIGARIVASGKLWRVRKGPYASRADAEAALAKVRAAGYSDARIQRAD